MNRMFPGQPDGWLGDQQAHAIAHEFIDKIDVLIDIHAGGTFPWVDYCYVVNDEGLSRAFLPQLLYKPANPYPNTTVSYAVQRDVRCMVVEIGGGYQEQHLHVANGVRGVMNQLRYCGVLPGEVKRRQRSRATIAAISNTVACASSDWASASGPSWEACSYAPSASASSSNATAARSSSMKSAI